MIIHTQDISYSHPMIIHERIMKGHHLSKPGKIYNKYISPLNKLMKDLYMQKNEDASDCIATLMTIREYLIVVYRLETYRKKRFDEEGFAPDGSFKE